MTNKTKKSVKKTSTGSKTAPKKVSSSPKKTSKIKGKKKKGFTLVELVAVVGLLAIVSTMAALSVSSISHSVKSRQKDNLLNSIQVAAEKYVNDTGIKKVYVQTLIKEGYVEADNDNQTIADPTDDAKILNCYLYDFTTSGRGSYSAPDDETSDDCSMEALKDVMLTIQYKVDAGSFSDYDGKWLNKENVTLGVKTNNEDVVSSSDIATGSTWTTPLAPDVYHSPSGTYNISGDVKDGYLNATYQVTVAKNGTTYTASEFIRIDSKAPVITNYRIDKLDVWTASKFAYFDLEDKGSGLEAYAISTTANTASVSADAWHTITGDRKIFNVNSDNPDNELTDNGTYYIHVRDKAGNTAVSASILVETIDHIPPRCTLSGTSTTWTNVSRIISWGCQDDETGCAVGYTGGSKTYSVSTRTDSLASYVIRDNVGNETTCPAQTVDVYVDMDKPQTVSLSIYKRSTYAYNSRYAHYDITASDVIPGKSSDVASGIAEYCFTDTNNSASCSWKTVSGEDITFAASDGSGTSYTRYAFVKDRAGNVSNKEAKDTYELYTLCTKTAVDYNYGYGECSKKCGGGIKKRPMKDFYLGGDKNCGLGADDSCNSFECCSSTEVDTNNCTGYQWSTCTEECGGGTKYEVNKCGYKSTYDGSTCPGTKEYTRNENTPCNPQACCDEGEFSYYSCSSSGYAIKKRYNGCLGKEESYEDTDDYCESEHNCSVSDCPTYTVGRSVAEMTVYPVCYYYYGGEYKSYTDYFHPYYCDYGDRYLGCSTVYVGRCYGDFNSSFCAHGWNMFGTSYALRGAYQVSIDYTCNTDVIGGYRYWCSGSGTEEVYVAACSGGDSTSQCLYHMTGWDPSYGDYSITGKLYRGDLRTGSNSC